MTHVMRGDPHSGVSPGDSMRSFTVTTDNPYNREATVSMAQEYHVHWTAAFWLDSHASWIVVGDHSSPSSVWECPCF